MSRFPDVPGGYPFPRLEEEVLAFWRDEAIFAQTLERPAPAGTFVFYEGPPTANNVPHVGHVVTRVIKDLFPRFKTMRGFQVPRKAGWDTHGLAVEIEVEKRLGFAGKQQIEEYGIAAFNRACLDSVHTYEAQWRAMTERIGYWIDLDHAYRTYSNEYIESVWWALAELSKRGLLTEGYKIQPYCARCGTTLSSHEVAQNYKEADDPSIWTLFQARAGQSAATLDGGSWEVGPDLYFVAWTTTPWTTLANVGLAVHPDLEYEVIDFPGRPGQHLVLGADLATPVPLAVDVDGKRRQVDLRDRSEWPALARISGRALEGLLYYRLYTFFFPEEPGRLVLGDYVTKTEGTGLVHTAPPFGEDDYQTGRRYGLPLIRSVDAFGRIVPGATPFAGLWFKDADPKITQDLKSRGLMLHSDRYKHNYPFCWRCDRPLLYYATESWFVKTTAEKGELVAKNREIHWHPEHIGEGRFGNWLENVVDWALSRRRYWGTPLPIWICAACGHKKVVGSYAELFAAAGLSGRALPADPYDPAQFDPHRPGIDEITWPCPECGGAMKRVQEVIDAWFDSGAMPFAQHHFMGEPLPDFDPHARRAFPADLIAEAVDQTRGWFYTLHVLGVLLFDSVAYRNCIVLGHVLDEKGRKQSKRLGNVVEPMAVIKKTGADALRWYFCVNDPEVPSRFSEGLVREAAQKFLLPLWNALSFFTIYANVDGWEPGVLQIPGFSSRPALDRWILLRLDRLVADTTAALEGYDVVGAARPIEEFLDDLTNWYIRRSRDRFWAAAGPAETPEDTPAEADKESAYQTLYEVLTTLSRLLAPFTPFVAEVLHQQLVRRYSLIDKDRTRMDESALASVHLADWPRPVEGRDEPSLLASMAAIQRIVRLGHAARNEHGLKTRQPLAAVTLVTADPALPVLVEPYSDLLKDELNVKEIRWAADRAQYVHHEVRPLYPKLGPKLGKRMGEVKKALESADGDALAAEVEGSGKITVALPSGPVELAAEDVEIRLIERPGAATQGDRELLVALETALTPELVAGLWAREVVHRIQTARKDKDLDYADRIRVRYRAAPELDDAIAAHRAWISGETLAVDWTADGDSARAASLTEAPVEGLDFAFAIERV
ncbi:MAG: isoleucyl-tRNA synthetase [Acidobacteriota bacterium]|nr:isoleucyl-tRNA synthetase [Acidobacteriota bacterium]